jgi:hypothetical protein
MGKTVLTAQQGAFGVFTLLGSSANKIRDLTISIPEFVATDTVGLNTSGTATRIAVNEDSAQNQERTGVHLEKGGTLEDSTVTLEKHGPTLGVQVGDGGGTVRHSSVLANFPVAVDRGGLIERSRLEGGSGGVGISMNGTIRDTLITVDGAAAVGLMAGAVTGADANVDADGLTIIGPSTPDSIGAGASSPVAWQSKLTLRNSVIRGFGHSLGAVSSGPSGDSANVTASYSAYDRSNPFLSAKLATINESNITNVSDPGLTADYTLAPGSPLIDAGDPNAGDGLDLNGNSLLVDGNGDGIARRDIGAFEFQPAPPAPTPATGADPTPPAPPTGTAADLQAPLVSGFKSSKKAFAVGRARTAISALVRGTVLRYKLSEAATVTIQIKRAGAKRAAGRLVRKGKAGANSIRFTGRIGKRALRPGRYSAVLTATDAAGNRSKPSRLTFRVLRG